MSSALIPIPLLEYDIDGFPIVRSKQIQESLDVLYIEPKLKASKVKYRFGRWLSNRNSGLEYAIMGGMIFSFMISFILSFVSNGTITPMIGIFIGIATFPIFGITIENFAENYNLELKRIVEVEMPAQRVQEFRAWSDEYYDYEVSDEELTELIENLVQKQTDS